MAKCEAPMPTSAASPRVSSMSPVFTMVKWFVTVCPM